LKKGYPALAAAVTAALKQLAKIFRQLRTHALPRYELGLTEFLTGGELHPIRWEPVFDQAGALHICGRHPES
jgi:hypothetical protein